ncbi:hypothetical protein [Acrocarpospora catenulata]|uniref:hypothetical protein n=1 Tax=Acrocarpospora catenulata TaxID=2836182 RepID=UPI001BD97A86|nr:hypothetical protein [Acrocarpospora catenulata]
MYLAAVASPRQQVAFPAYFALTSPALRDAARGPLRRALHNGRYCSGVQGSCPCHTCEQWIADLAQAGYDRLRTSLAGNVPQVRNGEPVREMQTIVEWVTSLEATTQDIDTMARLLRGRPSDEEPSGLRAARAQLIRYQLISLEARISRKLAQSRGASARPDRDLMTSAWAAPLRENRVAFNLLVDAILRLRHGSRDLYGFSPEHIEQLNLDHPTARRLLRQTLDHLHALRPEFYLANVFQYLSEGDPLPWTANTPTNPEELLIQTEETQTIRRRLTPLLTTTGSPEHRVLERICAAATNPDPNLIEWAATELNLKPTQAEAQVREWVNQITQADLDWATEQCHP